MLIVGLNGKLDWQGPGCTPEEYRTQFALWCLSAAPLLIGCDLRARDELSREILLNSELIAVNRMRPVNRVILSGKRMMSMYG